MNGYACIYSPVLENVWVCMYIIILCLTFLGTGR